jgi:hypothetical protein
MTSMHVNSMRTNVAVNDNVVAGRMGTGSQLANVPPAILSPGSPAVAGPEPTPMTREVTALVDIDYRDATCERAGRSEFSPNAGGRALARPGHARTAIACRWPLAKQQGFMLKPLFRASAKRETSAR